MIQRKNYLDNLIALKDKEIIKVVTGVRRCGKSTLFELYIDYLKQMGVDDNQIISVNLEAIENSDLLDYRALYDYITAKLVTDKNNYIFIDEVQKCIEFEKRFDYETLIDDAINNIVIYDNFIKTDDDLF